MNGCGQCHFFALAKSCQCNANFKDFTWKNKTCNVKNWEKKREPENHHQQICLSSVAAGAVFSFLSFPFDIEFLNRT